jgi:hypothetical protein
VLAVSAAAAGAAAAVVQVQSVGVVVDLFSRSENDGQAC